MQRHRRRVLVATTGIAAVIALVMTAALIVVPALATPPVGVTTNTIAVGRFDSINTKIKTGAWKAKISTKGASDLHVLENTILPGGPSAGTATPVPAW
jgi:hypothetical protein